VLAGRRLAVSAVREVEQAPADDHRRDVGVLAALKSAVACELWH